MKLRFAFAELPGLGRLGPQQDRQATGPDGKKRWTEYKDVFEGMSNTLPNNGNASHYMYRVITAKEPLTIPAITCCHFWARAPACSNLRRFG